MLERKIQKHALVFAQNGVESQCDGGLGDRERLWIRGKRARRIAEDIARHLVQHDHRSKGGLRIGQEPAIASRRENLMQVEKTVSNARVKHRVLLEPLVR